MGNAATPATLIVGPSWVGDMVMAQSLFSLLAGRYPEHAFDVLAPAWSLPIVARMPEIRRGIASQTGHGELGLRKRWRIGRTLAAENYRRAIVMPRSLKSSLIPVFAGIPRRSGFRGESRYWLINDKRPFDRQRLDQTVKRFVALGLDDDEPLPPVSNPSLRTSAENQRRLLSALSLDVGREVIAMMPGAEYGPAKCWPLPYFGKLAALLCESGFAVWVLGSDKDRAAGDAIAASSDALNLCGETSLEDVIDLLALCQQAVSNDSGLMHIAAAVGSHVHGIYGSSSPAFTPPLTARRNVHYLGLSCSPCFERHCPLNHLRCLREIEVRDVFLKVAENAQKSPK